MKFLKKSFGNILGKFSERFSGAICGRIFGGIPVVIPEEMYKYAFKNIC